MDGRNYFFAALLKNLLLGLLVVFLMLELTTTKAWALYMLPGDKKWPTPDVKVCWEIGLDTRFGTGNPAKASSVPNFSTYSSWFRDAVEDSWGRVANLRFIGWKDCTSRTDTELAGWVTIVWTTVNNTTNGYRTDYWTRMGLILPSDTSEASRLRFQPIVRHENGACPWVLA
ncbi:hypothetical protein HYR54_03730 [Candidatus Acetothermia bacterium]|nr:hypothetical protein [Candidatus Acetothermia bacterium]